MVRRWVADLTAGRRGLNLSEKRTSGNSRSRLETHLGVERKAAWRDEDVGGEEVNLMAGDPGEELLKTF